MVTAWVIASTSQALSVVADKVVRGQVQGVDVAFDGAAQPDSGILLLSQQIAGQSQAAVRSRRSF